MSKKEEKDLSPVKRPAVQYYYGCLEEDLTCTEEELEALRKITCCFTGHRPLKLPWRSRESDSRCVDTKQWIAGELEKLYRRGYRRFMCGMALGCDLYYAEEVINLRQKYEDVQLIAVIPCENQNRKWKNDQKLRYSELLGQCTVACIISKCYTGDCMHRRNKYMVDHSTCILACFDGTPGGTMNTVLLAERAGIEMHELNVSDLVRDKSRELPPELKK